MVTTTHGPKYTLDPVEQAVGLFKLIGSNGLTDDAHVTGEDGQPTDVIAYGTKTELKRLIAAMNPHQFRRYLKRTGGI